MQSTKKGRILLRVRPRGFCAGVVRAVDIVELALEAYGSPVYVHHEIVHNTYVVEQLRRGGATVRRRRYYEQFRGAHRPVSHRLPAPIPRCPRRAPRRRKTRGASPGAGFSPFLCSASSPWFNAPPSTLSYFSPPPEHTRFADSRCVDRPEAKDCDR